MASEIKHGYPFSGWTPRDKQRPAWDYLSKGGKHAELVWHRRYGKDDVALHHTACEMIENPGTYWHMLPKANQVKKAIWDAVDFHSGKRRIDLAFPEYAPNGAKLFERRESDMFIRCKLNGSTWQCFGSDNYEGAIGSGPRGIVYSEWAQANPSARGYFRPMVRETKGWELYVTTPRGKNHAYTTYHAAKSRMDGTIHTPFAELLTVHDTGALTAEELLEELTEYVSTYGESMGLAFFQQEYECSFDAAILGAIWGDSFQRIDQEGRICHVPHDPGYPVHVTMDIGRTDDTAIWFFQVIDNQPRIIETYYSSGKDPDHYASVIIGSKVSIDIVDGEVKVRFLGEDSAFPHHQEWEWGTIWLPHDARAKTFAAHGKSVEEQFAKVFGAGKVGIVPNLSLEDGIIAARQMLRVCIFDVSCEDGIDACRFYHREWDDERKMFKSTPEHDWSSHFADALRYLGIVWMSEKPLEKSLPPRWKHERTIDEMIADIGKKKRRSDAFA